MVRANGLIILPEEATAVRRGEMVTVQLLDDSRGLDAGTGVLSAPFSITIIQSMCYRTSTEVPRSLVGLPDFKSGVGG